MQIKNKLLCKITELKYKETHQHSWKFIFLLEQLLIGGRNKNYVFTLIRNKIKTFVNSKLPSSYKLTGHINYDLEGLEKHLSKKMEGSGIKLIIPESTEYLSPPNTLQEKFHPEFLKRGNYLKSPSVYLYSLKNGRIIGKRGAIASYGGEVFSNLSYVFDSSDEKKFLFNTYISHSRYKKGVYATINSTASTSYFHWIFDCLPRLKIIEDSNESFTYLIVPKGLKKYHKESLNLLGYNSKMLLEMEDNSHYLCEKLLVPSFPGKTGKIPKWSCYYLREKLIPKNIEKPYRKIYISRKDAIYRKVTNEEEIEQFLLCNGFEIIEMSSYSLLEQIRICAEAKVVIAPHGAGLSNIVFCQKATIIEIFSPSYVNLCFWNIANMVGNKYYYLLGQDTNGYVPHVVWRDFKVNIEELRRMLNRLQI